MLFLLGLFLGYVLGCIVACLCNVAKVETPNISTVTGDHEAIEGAAYY